MNALIDPASSKLTLVTSTRVTGPPAAIRVLLVEDDPDSAELVRIFLLPDEEGMFHVERCATLLEGMQRSSQGGIDVVLLDLGLPELSGDKSFRAMMHSAQGLPVVVFTGDESDRLRRSTLKYGATDYLVKEKCSPALLKATLRRVVADARRRQRPSAER